MAKVKIVTRNNRDGKVPPILPGQRKIIQETADDAERIAKEGYRVLCNIWDQSGHRAKKIRRRKSAWKANNTVVRWFGSRKASNLQIKRTRRRMGRIRDQFKVSLRFAIIQHQHGKKSFLCKKSQNRGAYTSPGTRIKLCPHFFTMGRKDRARLLIHEICHLNGQIHRRGATDYDSAKQLASEHPRAARRNPENYAQYCNEF